MPNFLICFSFKFPPKYPHSDVVVGLVCSNDSESYAGGNIATGRASHMIQVKGNDSDIEGYPGPPVWGLGMGLMTSPHENVLLRSFYGRG